MYIPFFTLKFMDGTPAEVHMKDGKRNTILKVKQPLHNKDTYALITHIHAKAIIAYTVCLCTCSVSRNSTLQGVRR